MRKITSLFFLSLLFFSCEHKNPLLVEVKNDLDFQRKEVVSVSLEDLKGIKTEEFNYLHIQEAESEKYQRTQLMDADMDGKFDTFLFQAEVPANGKKTICLW
ncbi:MAG TPA: DUF4861 domain-containing protein [Leeuwenhoekiella sp.]|nr:DUF4861 domain-containing protein [Leeuwenhoekiella sp.]